MQINVAVTDSNNIVCNVVPPQTQTITIDRGVAGNGIVSIVPVTISTFQYLRITYTNGTVQDVGPLTSTAYTATSPITIVGNTISLSTVPIASGGTGATTAATAIENLLPSYTGNANKRLGLNSGGTALEWVADGGGTVTSIAASGGSTGLTFTGSPITSSGTLTLGGTLAVASGGTGATTAGGALTNLGAIGAITSTDGSVTITSTGTSRDLSVAVAAATNNVIAQVRNTTGATLAKGTVVYISGATGQLPTVSKAIATGDATSAQTLGMMTADLANNSNGNVTIIGLITNIDTSAYTDGAQLYLSGTTAGAVTATKPSAPTHLVYVAVVEYAHPVNGKLFVKVQNGYELDEIHDVSIVSPVTGQTLVYNSSTSLWSNNTVSLTAGVNGTLAIANGGTGQTTANAALNALLPTQTGNASKYLQTDGTNATWDAISLSTADITGILPTANGGTGLGGATPFTANGLVYASSASALTTGSALTFNGTALTSLNNSTAQSIILSRTSAVARNWGLGIDGDGGFRLTDATGSAVMLSIIPSGVAYLASASELLFKYNTSVEGMRLTSTGLGIGVTSPSFKLDVGGQDGTNIALRSTGTSAARFRAYVNSAESGVIGFLNGGGQFFEVAGTEQMRLTSTGLGIGTSSPASKLHVSGASAKLYVDLGGNNYYQASNQIWQNYGGGTEYMRLDSSGNLGLGVTPSAWSSGKAFEIGGAGQGIWLSGGNDLYYNNNAYYNSGWKYGLSGNYATSYRQVNGQHIWSNAPSGTAGNAISFTQAMTLDASGNLGIGTTSPSSFGKLAVNGNIVTTTDNVFIGVNDGSDNKLSLVKKAGGFPCIASASSAPIIFSQSSAASIVSASAETYTERARIDSSGNFLFATTVASEISGVGLKLFSSSTVPAYRCVMDTATAGAAGYILYNGNATNNGYRFYVQSNGGIANYQANDSNLSDVRTKTDIQDAGGYLAKICAIPVRTFRYKDQSDDLLNLGVIAQEVEAIAPELVDVSGFGQTPDDGVPLKAIYQTDLQYALMKCIQEQQAIIESLKARLDAANL
ncbi:Intramolecular chaperone auto-processing domain containing protein [uncultured Caudovirales phage]|uniref:Intramolecular chaperone auto-processing domain containing protein n=1 Tax=uncultured Caudovirales phage TaxID=2100421 RepID=A0A6J7XLS9_9CAUD|nr:Intramolecular chaperone auto-processing domain containing protein [uncultured Caudovirales phage]